MGSACAGGRGVTGVARAQGGEGAEAGHSSRRRRTPASRLMRRLPSGCSAGRPGGRRPALSFSFLGHRHVHRHDGGGGGRSRFSIPCPLAPPPPARARRSTAPTTARVVAVSVPPGRALAVSVPARPPPPMVGRWRCQAGMDHGGRCPFPRSPVPPPLPPVRPCFAPAKRRRPRPAARAPIQRGAVGTRHGPRGPPRGARAGSVIPSQWAGAECQPWRWRLRRRLW